MSGTGHEGWSRPIGWVINNRLFVGIFAGILVMAGLWVCPLPLPVDIAGDPVPVDAIPDIGENQQIIFSEWPGRSPKDVEDQITYPLTTALMQVPGVKTVRSSSALGFSTISLIFDDDVAFYWARSRILERLASLPEGTVPDDVQPTLGPDATALGQVFWYTLEGQDPTSGAVVGGWDPDELRSIQDWTVRQALQAVDGVSEVSSIGGFVREYQVDVDPEAMRAHGVQLQQIVDAVHGSNLDVGARTLEINGVEYVVRGVGLVDSLLDLEQAVVVARDSTPVRLSDVGRVSLGPALRRGALDDEGALAVGGVVVARHGVNPLDVLDGVHEQIAALTPGLPRRTLADGTISQVTVVPFYDRSTLIGETLDTLSSALYQQLLITIIVVVIMLRDLRSAGLISGLLPMGVLGTFVLMKLSGVGANIMALGGIAIAIGSMVDIGIVFVENINQHLREAGDRRAAVRAATAEVAPAVLTAVLTTVVSFLPVLGLTDAELRLFAPLVLTKTFAMIMALVIALLVLPGVAVSVFSSADTTTPRRWLHDGALVVLGLALSVFSAVGWLVVGLGVVGFWAHRLPWLQSFPRVRRWVAVAVVTVLLSQDWMPLGPAAGQVGNVVFVAVLVAGILGAFRWVERRYPVWLGWALDHRRAFLALPVGLVLLGGVIWQGVDGMLSVLPSSVRQSRPAMALQAAFPGLGSEYMPPFDEGAFLYMPTTMPHASIGEVQDMMSAMDAAIAQVPEVSRVVGKLGRVDSALDPAPVSMIESLITYVPEYQDIDGESVRQWRPHIQSPQDIWDEIAAAAAVPGLTQAPVLMPIGARLVMLQSGLRAPMGVKIHGPDLDTIHQFGLAVEAELRDVPALRSETVFADRTVGKPYLEIVPDRERLGRYGLSVTDVQAVLQVALGGMTLTQTVEGRERYPVRVRYMREDRDSLEALERLTIPTATGDVIPLMQVADIEYVRGPQFIRSEDTFLTTAVVFDRQPSVSEVEAVKQASAHLSDRIAQGVLQVPEGVHFRFAGVYENQVRSMQRLRLLVPLALALITALLVLQFRRLETVAIIASGVLVAVSGGFVLLWLWGSPTLGSMTAGVHGLREFLPLGEVNLSVAVWIGFIALMGIATDDGVVMMTYLRQVFSTQQPKDIPAIRSATVAAGQRRVRPCLMTTATTLLALLPVISAQGRGADIMRPMAIPIIGGMLIELVTIFVVPVLYCALQERRQR